jgi:DNA-binding transcriptional LysR family regulator
LDIRELVSFYHTARLRSVSRAADYLEIGQPTVTTHLQRLEKEFGVQLFDRIKRPIRLTSEGSTLFRLAESVVQAVQLGMENIRIEMNHPDQRGVVTMGAYPDLALNYLPEIIKQYLERFPEVQLKLVSRPYAALLQLLESGEVDLALLPAPTPENRGLAFQSLFESTFVLMAPLGHPLLQATRPVLDSIVQWPLIMPGPQSYTRRYLEQALRQAGLGYHMALEMEHTALTKRYAEIGMGVTIALEFDVRPGDETKLGAVDLSHLFPPVQIGVVTLAGKFLSRAARNLVEALLASSTAPKGR